MVATGTLTTAAATEPPEGEGSPARRWRRVPVAWLPVAAVVAWQGWYLRSELNPAHYPNDSSFHLEYLRWAADRLSNGDSPLDGIFANLGLGFPVFEHYQVLPYLVSAPFAWLFGAPTTYSTILYLLLVCWPIAVYAATRLFEFDRTTAAAAAVVAPFVMSVPGYGFELGSYVWRGYGMWTLAWGMWLFAFALACSWRAIFRGRSLTLAAGLLAALITSHLLTGFLAAVVIVVWPVVGPAPRAPMFRRSIAVTGVASLASAWLLVPSFLDRGGTYFDNPPDTSWRDSHGVGQVVRWLGGGDLFDAHRLPVLTLLAAVGLVAVVVRSRRDANARALLCLLAVSLVLFFGTDVVGPIVDRMPAREVLFLHRMIAGVHFGGVLVAGVGAAFLVRSVQTLLARAADRLPDRARSMRPAVVPAAVVALAVLVLAPAWTQVGSDLEEQDDWIALQREYEATDGRDFAALAGIAAAQDGRTFAGSRDGWGSGYRLGFVPGHIELLDLGVPAIGFSGRVPALTEPSEARYDSESATHAEVFDARWHIRPADFAAPPGGTLVASRGRHQLWSIPTTGAMTLADTTIPIASERLDVATASAEFLRSELPQQRRYPLLALDGNSSQTPTLEPGTTADGPPGEVRNPEVDPDGNWYAATVDARRDAALVVKTSWHPRWSARIDGEPADIDVVAPGLVAVDVPAGRHDVTLRYAGFPIGWRLLLAGAGALGLGALVFGDRARARRTAKAM